MSRHAPGRKAAFTMVELQVAIAIVFTLLMILGAVASYCWKAFSTGVGIGQSLGSATLVLETIEQDLLNSRFVSPGSLEGQAGAKQWAFPITVRDKAGKVDQRTVTYRLVSRKGDSRVRQVQRDGQPLRSARVTDLAFRWSDRPGRLIVEVEATDSSGRWFTRMSKEIGIRALQERAMYGQFFPETTGSNPAKVVTRGTRSS